MAVTKTIGYDADGVAQDYTTFALFNAAWGVDPDMPTTLTEVITAEIYYSDAIQGTCFDEQVVPPAITPAGFSVKYVGMYGNAVDKTCPAISQFYITAVLSLYCPYLFENLIFDTEITNTYASYAYFSTQRQIRPTFLNCYIHSTNFSIYSKYTGANIVNSFIDSDNNGIYCSSRRVYISNSVLVARGTVGTLITNSQGCTIKNSSLVTANIVFSTMNITDWAVSDSIIHCKKLTNTPEVTNRTIFTTWTNSCVYQSDYIGKFSSALTFAEAYPGLDEIFSQDMLYEDPKFVNASGATLADFALQSGSPCRYENKAEVANVLYPTNSMGFVTMGAWSDYEAPDYPATTDVYIDVTYSNGSLSGVFNPYSSTQTGTLVLPSGESVLYDNSYGASGVQYSGKWHQALPVNNLYNTTYGVDNISESGSWQQAINTDLLYGSKFGIDGISESGAYSPDFPTRENTLDTDTTNNESGLWQIAATGYYAYDQFFGVSGVSLSGVYEGGGATDLPTRENVLYTDTVNNESGLWHPANSSIYLYDNYFGVSGVSESGAYSCIVTPPARPDAELNEPPEAPNITGIL